MNENVRNFEEEMDWRKLYSSTIPLKDRYNVKDKCPKNPPKKKEEVKIVVENGCDYKNKTIITIVGATPNFAINVNIPSNDKHYEI